MFYRPKLIGVRSVWKLVKKEFQIDNLLCRLILLWVGMEIHQLIDQTGNHHKCLKKIVIKIHQQNYKPSRIIQFW